MSYNSFYQITFLPSITFVEWLMCVLQILGSLQNCLVFVESELGVLFSYFTEILSKYFFYLYWVTVSLWFIFFSLIACMWRDYRRIVLWAVIYECWFLDKIFWNLLALSVAIAVDFFDHSLKEIFELLLYYALFFCCFFLIKWQCHLFL